MWKKLSCLRLPQVFQKIGFPCTNKNIYDQGNPPLGFNCDVCPWNLFAGSNPPDKFSLKKIHEHVGFGRTWTETLRLQLASMHVACYGSEDNYPIYDPVISDWDGKETLATAHARMAHDVETVDIEGLEVIVEANYVKGFPCPVACYSHWSHKYSTPSCIARL